MNTRPVIEFVSVSKCFYTDARGAVWAVRDFTLSCAQGELTCLVGPSGCGKTTLLRLAAGLEKPTNGHVFINGTPAGARNGQLGLISQESDLLPWRRVEDNVALGLELRGVPRAQRHQIALHALRKVGLPEDIARSYPHELSGGMRQRVVLARIACLQLRILLMDEPFANLDEPTRFRLQDDLLALWQAERQTILFVTHSLDEAVYLADRIVVMTFAGIATECRVALPRPRDRAAQEFTSLVSQLRKVMETPNVQSQHMQPTTGLCI